MNYVCPSGCRYRRQCVGITKIVVLLNQHYRLAASLLRSRKFISNHKQKRFEKNQWKTMRKNEKKPSVRTGLEPMSRYSQSQPLALCESFALSSIHPVIFVFQLCSAFFIVTPILTFVLYNSHRVLTRDHLFQ